MYKIGDVVIYGTEGICKIKDITEKRFEGNKIEYYILCPLKKAGETVYVPCRNEKIMSKMRAVLTEDGANQLLNKIPVVEEMWIENERERQRAYKDILLYGTSEDLMIMAKNLHLHQERQEERGKKLHVADERFLKDAEKMLIDELAYALGITNAEVWEMVSDQKELHQ